MDEYEISDLAAAVEETLRQYKERSVRAGARRRLRLRLKLTSFISLSFPLPAVTSPSTKPVVLEWPLKAFQPLVWHCMMRKCFRLFYKVHVRALFLNPREKLYQPQPKLVYPEHAKTLCQYDESFAPCGLDSSTFFVRARYNAFYDNAGPHIVSDYV